MLPTQVAATLLFEGSAEQVRAQQTMTFKIAARYGGVSGGESNGKRGYFLTYMIGEGAPCVAVVACVQRRA